MNRITRVAFSFFFGTVLLTAMMARGQEPLTSEVSHTFTAQHDKAELAVSLDTWKASQPPFYFKYDGKESPGFIASWPKTELPVTPSESGETHHYVYTDPATKLKIVADVRTYTDFDAIDWVLHISNEGTTDTPILEDIKPLHWSMQIKGPFPLEHWASGSYGGYQDFGPMENESGPTNVFQMESRAGRPSNGTMPYFNVQNDDQGVIGAIGWSGDWHADFCRPLKEKVLDIQAGMKKTHLLLHPGETIRTPRIVLLNWKGGDWRNSQNTWRKLMLAHYAPREPDGSRVRPPMCCGSWGTELIDAKISLLQKLHDAKVPYDVYWVDAGWYGDEAPKPGTTVDGNSPWDKKRGTWIPNAISYPHGLKPLGDAAKKLGFGFLLWIEPQTADPGSLLRTQHPDWFLTLEPDRAALVNLGNPEARKGITDLVSNIVTEAGLTWYREDFNIDPDKYWASGDTPDRVGMTEIGYVTGFYQFWDDLRAAHPGLQIDNCCSGGRRLDIEALSRSIPLWRSDLGCNPIDPIGGQMLTQGLAPWVPLNSGVFGGTAPGTPKDGASLIYAQRSSYSAGWIYNAEAGTPDSGKATIEEYREVQPYFIGDFYPLLSYTPILDFHALVLDAWTAWQFDRPDLKSGLVVLLRRQESPITTLELTHLHAIDPAASYDVEVRFGRDKAPVQHMSGKKLLHLQITIPDAPGSALVFYHQL